MKELESGATGGMVPLLNQDIKSTNMIEEGKSNELNQGRTLGKSSFSESCVNVGKDRKKSSTRSPSFDSRSTLEDMELATRALTEPLPTNQQVRGI